METSTPTDSRADETRSLNFIEQAIDHDLASGRFKHIATRFPPEPNGYLHLGHAKSICLNFGLAVRYQGTCNLRFDDTNPTKEETEYVDSIMDDVRWLGFEWNNLHYASDYFEQLYVWATQLIRDGKAYVCDLTGEQTREYRGTLTSPGKNSPFRDRSVEENLDLFQRMRAGEFPDGARTLRAKIDMSNSNFNLRDPVMYRILHAHHHRTGDAWCLYPMYDWAHGQSDSLENISFSICTLEFENHRPLYDWFCKNLNIHQPRQIEFARMNLTFTVMSKRKLLLLVKEGHVTGWDDPRMPTLSGIRRRGFTPESIRAFCERIGVAKFNSTIDVTVLENSVRDHLNKVAPRRMAVLNPLKLVISNWPNGKLEMADLINNPEDTTAGSRQVPFSGELWIEQDDFREEAPKKYFRLKPGGAVRLRGGYIVDCHSFVKNDAGDVTEVHCTYDETSRSGHDVSGRKVKATIHWVSAAHAIEAEIRLYDRLFKVIDPEESMQGGTFLDHLNTASLTTISAKIEPALGDVVLGEKFQFERIGYFCVDPDSRPGSPVFNRTVSLRDTWGKIEGRSAE